jgi:putative ABC transport system substrate-binding protein
MRRRDFIALVGALAAAWPLAARAQQPARLPRVVYFTAVSLEPGNIGAYQQGLAERGYVDGKNITLEYVIAPTIADLPAYAAKIVASKPDIIVCWGGAVAGAVQTATKTIPIVFLAVGDPVGFGLVASLARPGGNITGIGGELQVVTSKQMAILREAVPGIKRVAVLYLPASPANALRAEHVRTAAIGQGVEPVMIGFVDGQDLVPQFERVVAAGVQAAFDTGSQYTNANRDLLWELLVKAKIPAFVTGRVESGAHLMSGVVSYGVAALQNERPVGEYVDHILKGVKPADIPVQQPRLYDFAVDLKAAKLIGITIPPSILAQATLIIE